MRYELAEFVSMIHKEYYQTYKLMPNDSIAINSVIEKYLKGESIRKI